MDHLPNGHLLEGLIYILMALYVILFKRLTGKAYFWMFPFTSCPMSPLSRRLLISYILFIAGWEILRGIQHSPLSLPILFIMFAFAAGLYASYRRDRRLFGS